MLSDEQLQMRTSGLGSSDISAIVGESPYRTAHDVYLEKRGLVEPFAGNDATWLGSEMEPTCAKRYTIETGIVLRAGPGTVRHPEQEWMLATTDYEHADGASIVECKWVGGRVMSAWTSDEEGVPPYVMTQVQWQMLVRGILRADVIACFGATAEFRIYEIAFNDPIAEALFSIAERFWHENVLAGVPPPVDHTESAKRMLLALYGRARAPLAAAPPEAAEWFERRLAAEPELKRWTEEYDLANNKLRDCIRDAEGIVGHWGKATWKADKRGRRTLRVYPAKEKAA